MAWNGGSAVMGGAYRRSGLVQELEIALGELVLEWVRVPRESPLAGRSIGEARIRKRTGAPGPVEGLLRQRLHAIPAAGEAREVDLEVRDELDH